jgi:UDP-N-acetylglucosamine 2-epimerase (non-hydrolysing)
MKSTNNEKQQMKKKVLFIFGTRLEVIKMAPLIAGFLYKVNLETKVCVTTQHREMLDQVLDFFSIDARL